MRKYIYWIVVYLTFFSIQNYAQVSGKVFRDLNANGVKDNSATFNEPFLAGITVNAYNSAGALVGTATTGSTGTYSFSGLTLPIRVEFLGGMIGDYTSPVGAGNMTSVQFYSSASTTADYGLFYPDEYVGSTNPKMTSVQHVGGDPIAGGTASTASLLKTIDYNSINSTLNNLQNVAVGSQVGSLWGLAWHAPKNKLFSAAFVKRHVGLGPLGVGGIYVTDYSTGTGTTSNFIDLDAIVGIDLGTVGSNSARGLPANFSVGSVDASVFGLVGKAGLGDIDISMSQKKLYVTNLFERNIIVIDIANYLATGSLPTAANVTELSIAGMPSCTNGVARPFALKVYRDKLYVGVTCTGELDAANATAANMSASVLTYDLITNSWNTVIANSSLNYTHGKPQVTSDTQNHPWSDLTTSTTATVTNTNGWMLNTISANGKNYYQASRVSPWLTDIEFDVDGSMILGIRDRTGDQWGGFQPHPTVANTIMDIRVGGDILRYYYNGSTYTREANGTTAAGGGCGTNEYYCGESYTPTPTSHEETSQGGLALLAGAGEVVLSSINPTTTIWSGGLIKLNNTTGQKNSGILFYQTTEWNVTTLQFGIGLGGKSNGMGDVEILSSPPPLEIGNRIWNDANANGIQDANETPIPNVSVILCDASGNQIATTTTNATGNWYFNATNVTGGLLEKTNYIIKIGSADWSGTTGIGDLASLTLTNSNTDTSLNGDTRDSDAILQNGAPQITYMTGNYGQNDHTIDFGFKTASAICTTPAPPVLSVTNNQCPALTGSFSVLTSCGAGTHIEYSTNNGATWVTTLPTWANGVSVIARCVNNVDATCYSNNSTPVTATLNNCCPDSCIPVSITPIN